MQSPHRIAAEQVYVNNEHPTGLTPAELRTLPCEARRQQPWRPVVRFAQVRECHRAPEKCEAVGVEP